MANGLGQLGLYHVISNSFIWVSHGLPADFPWFSHQIPWLYPVNHLRIAGGNPSWAPDIQVTNTTSYLHDISIKCELSLNWSVHHATMGSAADRIQPRFGNGKVWKATKVAMRRSFSAASERSWDHLPLGIMEISMGILFAKNHGREAYPLVN